MKFRCRFENIAHTDAEVIFMNSIWSETVELPEFETLRGDRKTDVLIIGGGMAGILCAYMLQQAGVRVLSGYLPDVEKI